ncbi:MAG: hypothetical protein AAF387_20860 [Pseudomonadota bacterium]
MSAKLRFVALILASILISACSRHIQTTSGNDYLAAIERHNGSADDALPESIETRIRKAAAIEPTLRFPIRLGLAKIQHGRVKSIPPDEASVWLALQERLNDDFGKMIPIHPISVNLATGESQSKCDTENNTVNQLRLAGATQHLDAILMYEIKEKDEHRSNMLSVANLTVIGGFLLPTTSVTTDTSAHALLIDVEQGYPYGAIDVGGSNEILATTWGSDSAKKRSRAELHDRIMNELSGEAFEMFRDLRIDLAEKRAVDDQ